MIANHGDLEKITDDHILLSVQTTDPPDEENNKYGKRRRRRHPRQNFHCFRERLSRFVALNTLSEHTGIYVPKGLGTIFTEGCGTRVFVRINYSHHVPEANCKSRERPPFHV